MDAPQGPDEVQPVVEALRLLDARLDVIWNPHCVMTRPGEYRADGSLVAPTWDGRWQVVLRQSATQTATWRDHEVILTVTAPATSTERAIHALTHNGPYAPVGPWLVEHMQKIDRANAANLAAISQAIDAEWARYEQHLADDTAAAVHEAALRIAEDATREGGIATHHPVTIDLRQPA